jgi:hypothetical protein
MDQNYFQFDLEYYKQSNGLAMGAPTSATLAETYPKYGTHTNIRHPKNTTDNHIY